MDKSKITITIPFSQFEELQQKDNVDKAWEKMGMTLLIEFSKLNPNEKPETILNKINDQLLKDNINLKFVWNPNIYKMQIHKV